MDRSSLQPSIYNENPAYFATESNKWSPISLQCRIKNVCNWGLTQILTRASNAPEGSALGVRPDLRGHSGWRSKSVRPFVSVHWRRGYI